MVCIYWPLTLSFIEKFKQYDDALSSIKACLLLRKQILGLSHKDVAKTIRALGNLHRAKGDYQLSLSCFKECLRMISNDVETSDDINIGHLLKDLSETLIQMEKWDQALYCLNEATEIYKSQSNNTQYLGKCFGLLGHVYSSRGDISNATQYYELSIVSFQENHPQKDIRCISFPVTKQWYDAKKIFKKCRLTRLAGCHGRAIRKRGRVY